MPVSRQRVRDFYEARMSRDPNIIAEFLDDDVEWTIAGPVDLIPFCGQHHGKAAAIDTMVRVAPSVFKVTKLNIDELLVDGDRAAGFNRLAAVQSGTGRIITYQRAEFFQFRDNKILTYRSVLDSFDAAEQMLGHAINTSLTNPSSDFAASGNRIAL